MSWKRSVPGIDPGTLLSFCCKVAQWRFPRSVWSLLRPLPERRGKDRGFLPSICLFLLLIGSGCGGLHHGPADLVIVNGQEPESLDPAIVTGQADIRAAQALWEGLTRYDPKTARPIPGLAERWEISEDGRTYLFHLRTNAVWSTGEPITAHDFHYSWMRILDPNTAADYAGQLFYVRGAEEYAMGRSNDEEVGIEALDDWTFRVKLNEPTPFFLDLCAFITLGVVPRQSIERHGDRWLLQRPLPVSGPYQLESWRLNDRIRLRKNPLYWDAENTRSERVDLLTCSSAATALNLYETGAADIVWDKELVPMELIDLLRERPDFHTYDYLGSYFFRFNVTRKPLDDARVRKALALAIDKRRIVEKITKAGERPISHLVPMGVANYSSPEGLGYDPEEARRLLAEAGFPGGRGFPRLQYMLNTVATHQKIAVELQAMWREELGIGIELRQMEWKVFLRAQRELDYDISRSSWVGDYNDANTFLDLFMSENANNRTGWKNDRYDALIREANATRDAGRREKLFQEAERLLVREELPIVPLYMYVGLEYFDPDRIEGIYPNILAEHPIRAIGKVKGEAAAKAKKARYGK
jgi:oligopeptide transport system substrate-binding protein